MTETERRLKDYLDSNQAQRERMCLEILAVQEGYSDVRPRLPKGGPDGGRDMQANYNGVLCFGAVGFVNGAADVDEHRKRIERKFKQDLDSALTPESDVDSSLSAFVFFTNVGLTPSAISKLKNMAYKKGATYCDIFDRERIRIVLDSNKGYAIRLRYLDIQLSDAEQKDFFTTWADGISSIVGSGLSGIERTTKRLQFLLEAQLLLESLVTIIKLDAPIWEASRGEFLLQTMICLRTHSDGLMGWYFGGGNHSIIETLQQWKEGGGRLTRNAQYSYTFSWLLRGTGQYDLRVKPGSEWEHPKRIDEEDEEGEEEKMIRTAQSKAVLEVDRRHVYFRAISEPFLDRFEPTCKLIDLDGCMILFDCNKDIAQHIDEIIVRANGYDLLELRKEDWRVEKGSFARFKLPKEAEQRHDSADWTTIRPAGVSSAFRINLMSDTPSRYDWKK